MSRPEDQSILGVHIEAHVGDDTSHINVGQDISSVSMGDVEDGVHNSVISGRDAHVHGDQIYGDRVAGHKTTIGSIVNNFFDTNPEQIRSLRNRQAMLKLMRSIWIEGVLRQSLYNQMLINLHMDVQPEAVNRPWGMMLEVPGHQERQLPQNTKMIDVFDEVDQSLLILGEPGSGKTTLLLDLAKDLVTRAEKDPKQPIPLVFNLSSWSQRNRSFDEWLINEIKHNYQMPSTIAQRWIVNDELVLLLDGLDEAPQLQRNFCLDAINEFRERHLIAVVVCSRIYEYEALTTRLNARSAVVLQPLSNEQIDDYIATLGNQLAAVRQVVAQDSSLETLAKSPLMLNIMGIAYQGLSVGQIETYPTIEEQRRHLFDSYISRMFRRSNRPNAATYPNEKTLHWLAWLAKRMIESSQTLFFIELLQANWLKRDTLRLLYNLASGLVVGLITALFFLLLNGPLIGLSLGLLFGTLFGFMSSISEIQPVERSQLSNRSALFFGLCGGLIVGLFVGLNFGLTLGLCSGLSCWFIFGAIGSQRNLISLDELRQSWGKRLSRVLNIGLASSLIAGLLFGVVGLITGILGGVRFEFEIQKIGKYILYHSFDPITGLVLGLSNGMSIGLSLGLSSGLMLSLSGKENKKIEAELKTYPNQGIYHSLQHSLMHGLILGASGALCIALLVTFIPNERSWSIAWLMFSLMFGLIISLVTTLMMGGTIAINHSILRFILWQLGYVPGNYGQFLNYSATLVFLHRVGSGYVFIHRLLMEHFASLSDEDIQRIVSAVKTPKTT